MLSWVELVASRRISRLQVQSPLANVPRGGGMLSAIAVSLLVVTNTSGGTPAARIREYEAAYTAGYAETPSFARQTGLACSVCHTHYPELTATGRAFKLNGYVYRRADSLQGRSP